MHEPYALLKNVAVPAIVVNSHGRVTYWNRNAAEFFHLSADRAMGAEWHGVVHTAQMSGCCALCAARAALRKGEVPVPTSVILSVRGSDRAMVMVPMPIGQGPGEPIAFLTLAQDAIAASAPARSNRIELHARVRRLDEEKLVDALTVREREILACIVKGQDARSIAAHLGLSHATARNYVQRILTKLGVHNKAEAVSVALTYNLIAS
ncbi:MAG: LuxR C-terminal-related transcriptional regulator [Chloroflexota bacterium]